MKLPFGNAQIDVELPSSMELLKFAEPPVAKKLSTEEINQVFMRKISDPSGMSQLHTYIDNTTTIAIVVDDVARPTPTAQLVDSLMTYLEEELKIEKDQVVFIFGLGVHRKMTQEEAEMKLGTDIANTYRWENHDAHENLEYLGKSSFGTPIYINKTYYSADFKISIGLIEPHLWAGYSGGHKGIIPGVAGVKTIFENHKLVKYSHVDVGNLENNPFRDDLEEMVEEVGIDLLVNCVLNSDKEIHDIVIGEVNTAFQEGVEVSRKVSELDIPNVSDVIISSPSPLGIDFRQSSKAAFNTKNALKKGGTMIVVSECPEGRGNVTASEDPPSRWLIKLLAKILPSRILMWVIRKQGYGVEDAAGTFRMFKFIADYNYIFVSPNTSEEDREILFVADHYDTLGEALSNVVSNNEGKELTVNIFPQGGATYPVIM